VCRLVVEFHEFSSVFSCFRWFYCSKQKSDFQLTFPPALYILSVDTGSIFDRRRLLC
jgi:hypothetical protein